MATARRVLPTRLVRPMLPFKYCSRVFLLCSLPEEVFGSVPGGTNATSDTASWNSSPTRATICAFRAAASSVRASAATTISSEAAPGRVNTTELPLRTPGISFTSHSIPCGW